MRIYKIGEYDLTYEELRGERYRLRLTKDGIELEARYYPSFIDMADRGLRWAETIARSTHNKVEG